MGKIIVADASMQERKLIIDFLRKAGHQVVAETSDMGSTFRKVRSLYCDLVVVDSELEGGTGYKTASIIEEDQLAAILLVSNSDVFPQARHFHYIIKPVYYYTLIPAVEAAMMYWQRQHDLRVEIKKLEDKLETRKVVDKAKGVLIDNMGIGENEAHRFLQKEAMNRGLSLRQVANEILDKGNVPKK